MSEAVGWLILDQNTQEWYQGRTDSSLMWQCEPCTAKMYRSKRDAEFDQRYLSSPIRNLVIVPVKPSEEKPVEVYKEYWVIRYQKNGSFYSGDDLWGSLSTAMKFEHYPSAALKEVNRDGDCTVFHIRVTLESVLSESQGEESSSTSPEGDEVVPDGRAAGGDLEP